MASPFGRKANNSNGEDFELPPAGLHPANLIGLVDLGTHHSEYQGNPIEKRILFVTWELNTLDSDGKPFLIGQDFNSSLHTKSGWRKLLEGWRGRPFGNDEEFDPIVLLGAKCVVTIQIGLSRKDKKFSEVVSVAPPMKGQVIAAPVHPNFAWHLDTWADFNLDPPIPEWMPRNYGRLLVDEIKDSDEWKGAKSAKKWDAIDKPATNGGPVDHIMNSMTPTTATATVEREAPPF